MNKYLGVLCGSLLLLLQAQAQTLRIKCNSIQNLQIAVSGENALGKYTATHITNLSHDEWRTISLYDVKMGYDLYVNSEMGHENADSTWKWVKLSIYTDGAQAYDSLDLTKPARRVYMNNSGIIGKVKIAYDRRYMITEVILNDE